MRQKKTPMAGAGAGRRDSHFTRRATDPRNNPMQKHEAFILDELIPAVVNHARRVGVTSDEAALASFMALGTVLQAGGFTAESLLMAIEGSALATHDAPEGFQ